LGRIPALCLPVRETGKECGKRGKFARGLFSEKQIELLDKTGGYVYALAHITRE
jgi:hypothetical protein